MHLVFIKVIRVEITGNEFGDVLIVEGLICDKNHSGIMQRVSHTLLFGVVIKRVLQNI